MTTDQSLARLSAIRCGVVAGTAGGFAEVLWVSLYAGLTGADAASVASGVTTAVGMNALLPQAPVALGISIHMTIAVGLGVVLALVWQELSCRTASVPPHLFGVAALAAVWACNFFVVLPVLSPDFVHLVPYPVSLISKLLFGLAAAEVLRLYAPGVRWRATSLRSHRSR